MLTIPDHLFKSEGKIQDLILKANKALKDYEFDEIKFVREYQEGLIEYVEEVFKKVGESVAINLGVDPTKIKKSQRISLDMLKRLSDGLVYKNDLLYKASFDNLSKKARFARKWLSKFGFNAGQPLSPFRFKEKIKYNPLTKRPLTNDEWNSLINDIMKFLKSTIGSVEEEMVVRAGLFGKLIQQMESEGLTQNKIKKMSYDELESKYGEMPDTVEEVVAQYNFSDQEEKQLEYARQHALEHLAIDDGNLKAKIVGSLRRHITEGLRGGKSASELISDLYWTDPSDMLGQQFSNHTIEAWNRDWRRVALTEMKSAKSNGYLASALAEHPKKKNYFVFSGSYNPQEKSNESCNKWLGTVCLLVPEPLSDDRIEDEHADYAIWPGKNNVGRGSKNEWVCIPLHPHCFYGGQVFTSKGWLGISKVKIGDLVLSHKGRFKKITKVFTRKTDGKFIEIIFKGKTKVRCTEEHPFLTEKGWIEAGKLTGEEKINFLVQKCVDCGKKEIWYRSAERQRCRSCSIKNNVREAWKKEDYRKLKTEQSRKNAEKRYLQDPSLGGKIVKKAHEVSHKKIKEFNWLNTEESRRKSAIANSLGKRGSGLEKIFEKELRKKGINYVSQFQVGKYFLDFFIPEIGIGVEVDGEYWHDREDRISKEKTREDFIKSKGIDLVRFGEKEVRKKVSSCVDELERIGKNHKGEYEFEFFPIKEIKKGVSKNKTVHNFSVEDDESYIVNGFVGHNCTHFFQSINPEIMEWNEEIRKITYKEEAM